MYCNTYDDNDNKNINNLCVILHILFIIIINNESVHDDILSYPCLKYIDDNTYSEHTLLLY